MQLKSFQGEKVVIFYVDIPIAGRMGLKGGHLSSVFLFTLQKPYKAPGVKTTALIFLCCLKLKAPDEENSVVILDRDVRIKHIESLLVIMLNLKNLIPVQVS